MSRLLFGGINIWALNHGVMVIVFMILACEFTLNCILCNCLLIRSMQLRSIYYSMQIIIALYNMKSLEGDPSVIRRV